MLTFSLRSKRSKIWTRRSGLRSLPRPNPPAWVKWDPPEVRGTKEKMERRERLVMLASKETRETKERLERTAPKAMLALTERKAVKALRAAVALKVTLALKAFKASPARSARKVPPEIRA